MWEALTSMDDHSLSRALSSVWIRPDVPREDGGEDPGALSAAALFQRVRLAPEQCQLCHQLASERDLQAYELENLQRRLRELQQQAHNHEEALSGRIQQLSMELSVAHEAIAQLRNQDENSARRIADLERELQSSQGIVSRLEQELVQERTTARAVPTSDHGPAPNDAAVLDRFRDLCRPGWIVDRSELFVSEEVVGTGAYGSVRSGIWKACPVAVKAIHGVIMSPYNRTLFEREMYLYSLLSHPHLLICYGACTDDNNVPLLILERMSSSLRAALARNGAPLSLGNVIIVAGAVASALFYLHNLTPTPIVHRDLSSANVLLDVSDSGVIHSVKLSDFGSAHFVGQTQTTAPGAVIYSAPEVVAGTQDASRYRPSSDIYSFGVLIIEMFTGRQPDPQNRITQLNEIRSRNFKLLAQRCIEPDWRARPSAEHISSFISRMPRSGDTSNRFYSS